MDTRRYMGWADAAGGSATTIATGNATLAALMAALAGKSNASVATWTEGGVNVAAPAPVAADYISVRDQAVLIFADAAGALTQLTLPAPVASIFMADGQTVDPAQVTAITAAAIGTLVTGAGGVVTNYVGGYRRRLT